MNTVNGFPGRYEASPRTMASGEGTALLTDSIGRAIVITAGSTGTSDINVKQLNGTTTDTNSGVKSAGTLRVVIATDQPALTNAQPVTDRGATSGEARVSTSGTSAVLRAADAARKEVVIYNDSANNLFVRFSASAATSTAFAHKLGPGQTLIEDKYTGAITGILDASTGSAQVTEIT